MKRMICLLLCVVLALGCTAAQAAHYDTLSEKLSRQLEKGSGLKGAMTLTVEGDADWAKLLAPISGLTVTLRGIAADGRFEYTLYEGAEDGDHKGLTQVYGTEDKVFLRSDLLIDSLFALPLHGDVVSSLTGIGQENPTIYSAIAALSEIKDSEWQPVLAPYYAHIDQWLAPFASAPKVERVGVVSQVEITYTLPGEAIKAEMKDLMHLALADESLLKLLRANMTEEQAAAYLNGSVAWYYDALIDAMPFSADAVLVHRLSAQGDMLGSTLTFPLAGVEGWDLLTIEESGETEAVTVAVSGEQGTLDVTLEGAGGDTYAGDLLYVPVKGNAIGFAFTAERTIRSYSDEETRAHEVTDWTIDLEPVAEADSIAPATIQLRLHYYSKPADTQATTLEVAMAAELTGGKVTFAGRFRSASPWALSEDLPTENAKDLSAMTQEARTGVLSDLAANLLIIFAADEAEDAAAQTELPIPEEAATVTDLPEQAEAAS